MTTLEVARAYVKAGLSVIPVLADGSKRPAVHAWKEFQSRPPTDAELRQWFEGKEVGIAIVCGRVSGGLEVMDFENATAFEQWSRKVEEECPGLLAQLPRVKTPRGVHVYYRCGLPRGNTKLARTPGGECLVETRGEGGYVLAPGSPPACHPTGRTYQRVAGPSLTTVPLLATAAPLRGAV